jgi:hypothetical protein
MTRDDDHNGKHPLYDPTVARVMLKTYLDWEAADRPLDNPHLPGEIQDFLGEFVCEKAVSAEKIRRSLDSWATWLNGCFVGFLARETGFEKGLEKAREICQGMCKLDLPWSSPKTVYLDDGPTERIEFEVKDVSFVVAPTEQATTSATCLVESHMRESHGWDPDGQRI